MFDFAVTQIYITSEEEQEFPETNSVEKLIYDKDAKRRNVGKTVTVVSAKSRLRNRVDVAEFRKASEEDLRSAKGVRRLRKKVKSNHLNTGCPNTRNVNLFSVWYSDLSLVILL